MKIYYQWVSVSVDTFKQFFHTSHLLLSPGIGLGLGRCKRTIKKGQTPF